MGGTKHAPVGERGRESLDVDVSCGHLAYVWTRRGQRWAWHGTQMRDGSVGNTAAPFCLVGTYVETC